MNLDERLQKDLSPDIYCLVHNKIVNLEQQVKNQKEVIDKAIEYIENLQNEYNNSSVNESNIYLFNAYLHGVSKLIEIKEILKGE